MNTAGTTPLGTSLSHQPIPAPARAAALLKAPAWGLARAAHTPALQELCFAMGDYFEDLADGKAANRRLESLLPALLEDCRQELRERGAKGADFRILRAARLLWVAPALGARGVAMAERAWRLAWRGQPGAEVFRRQL